MDFLSRAVEMLAYECTYRVLASPFTYNSSPGIIPPDLDEMDRRFGLADYYHSRLLTHQFRMIGPEDPAPELIIMNLFHENSPLFINNEHKYIFFVDPLVWQEHPDFEKWMKDGFGMIGANPATYLKRYGEMLRNVRRNFPGVPILVVSRLSHFPAFGPDPYSYLEGWGDLWRTSGPVFRSWELDIPQLAILDMNRVFGGIWSASDKRIESHCPFLKFTLTEEDNVITGLHASRDVEHIGSMWPVLAGKVRQFMEDGAFSYSESEQVPDEWMLPWRPEQLERERLLEMLASGANYLCARAVGSFFLDLGTDYTDLLVRTAEFTPVCHNTLHMIKTYGRIWRNPSLTEWCTVHRTKVSDFRANGPLYVQDYLSRLDEIESYAIGL
ncbi:SGNH/GDSL hydrolase family protein [Maridesulfovibrio sp. FT414]|uniref:SGNH/GDSL hydrolase family protein n=1 Tax=Maridesulfovibrio sp. FT414 TaxID=2979469 RepID=UPI003D808A34